MQSERGAASAIPAQLPLISAVINYYNPRAFSRIEATVTLCLEALKEFSFNPIEVICSDGSGVESANVKAACERLGLTYTLSPIPQNYAAIYNHGLRLAKGQFIAVVENDVFVHKDWDQKIIGEMKRTGASLAVPYISSCDILPQQTGFVVRRRTFEPTMISQNLMFFDREAYEIGFPMDEQFNAAFNDCDTYMRLLNAGKRMIVCDAGNIVHYRRSSQIYNSFSYDADVAKFRAKYPTLKYWDKFGSFSFADARFARSTIYRGLFAFGGALPKRFANRFLHYLQRFESVFQGA
jgi:glycosyltransferase involved in cell wall biosynthesis